MEELFKTILIAIVCPLALPLVIDDIKKDDNKTNIYQKNCNVEKT